MATLSQWADDFISLLYPRLCYACLKEQPPKGDIICPSCQYDLVISDMHLDRENEVTEKFWGRVNIQAGAAMYPFSKAGKVQQLVHHLKYYGKKEVGIQLGEWYGRVLRESPNFQAIDLIIPVPLHPKKQRLRGYNQSDQFAMGLSTTFQKPWLANGLVRKVHSKSQTKKTRAERFQNVANVFHIEQPQALEGKHLLLVDDVLTTGATLEACAGKLLELEGVRVSLVVIGVAKM